MGGSFGRRKTPRPAVLIVCALVTAAFLDPAEMIVADSDAFPGAELAVVPGGDAGPRTLYTAGLYARGDVELVLLMGYTGGMMRKDTHASRWQTEWLCGRGVPASVLRFDSAARSTWEEAESVRTFMRRNGLKSAIVITDPPFMRRTRLTYRKVFEGSDHAVSIVAADSPWWRPEKWWSTYAGTHAVFHETAKLLYYYTRTILE